jgi:hypothetical protein
MAGHRLRPVGWAAKSLPAIGRRWLPSADFARRAALHRPPDQIGGALQALSAFGLGYLMDRALSFVLRRRAALAAQTNQPESEG